MVLMASLQETIRKQSEEIATLRTLLQEKASGVDEVRPGPSAPYSRIYSWQVATLKEHVSSLTSQLESSETKRKEVEKRAGGPSCAVRRSQQ